jgi:hypothetical protein
MVCRSIAKGQSLKHAKACLLEKQSRKPPPPHSLIQTLGCFRILVIAKTEPEGMRRPSGHVRTKQNCREGIQASLPSKLAGELMCFRIFVIGACLRNYTTGCRIRRKPRSYTNCEVL